MIVTPSEETSADEMTSGEETDISPEASVKHSGDVEIQDQQNGLSSNFLHMMVETKVR